MQFLLNEMIHNLKSLDISHISRACDFTTYLSEDISKFFKQLLKKKEPAYIGAYEGDILSLHSWSINSRTVYIATYEGYGSCSFCDHNENVNDKLLTVTKLMTSLSHNKRCIDELKKYLSDLFRKEIFEVFSKLTFFNDFNEAKKFILDRCEGPVNFK